MALVLVKILDILGLPLTVLLIWYGGDIGRFIGQSIKYRRQLKLDKLDHERRLQLAEKVNGSVQLLMADDELRKVFMDGLQAAANEEGNEEGAEVLSTAEETPPRRLGGQGAKKGE